MFSSYLTKNYPEAVRFLTNAITRNKLANSYVFIGKDNDDVLSIVINLAKILNCKANKNEISTPCEKCTTCSWLEKKSHPQALIIISPDLKSKKEQVKIDTIRELLNNLNTTSDFFRVIFFQNSNLYSLPQESSNLLLKSVEETPKQTIFIFANPTKNDILPTILSRSQIIYTSKEYNSIQEILGKKSTQFLDENLINCFPEDYNTALAKTKDTLEYLEKYEINLKEYLITLATLNYDIYKYSHTQKFCFLFENLSRAYVKYKSFIQPKVVIEDLFLQGTAI